MSAWDVVLTSLAKGEWPADGEMQKAQNSGERWPDEVRAWLKSHLPGIVFDDD